MWKLLLSPSARAHSPSRRLDLNRNPSRSVERTDEQIRARNVPSRRYRMESEICERRRDVVHARNTRQLVGSPAAPDSGDAARSRNQADPLGRYRSTMGTCRSWPAHPAMTSSATSIIPGKSGRLSASILKRLFTIVLGQIIGATNRLPGSKPVFSRLHPKIAFVTPSLCDPGGNRAGPLDGSRRYHPAIQFVPYVQRQLSAPNGLRHKLNPHPAGRGDLGNRTEPRISVSRQAAREAHTVDGGSTCPQSGPKTPHKKTDIIIDTWP